MIYKLPTGFSIRPFKIEEMINILKNNIIILEYSSSFRKIQISFCLFLRNNQDPMSSVKGGFYSTSFISLCTFNYYNYSKFGLVEAFCQCYEKGLSDFEAPFSFEFESEIYQFFTIYLILAIISFLAAWSYQLKKLGHKFKEIFAFENDF